MNAVSRRTKRLRVARVLAVACVPIFAAILGLQSGACIGNPVADEEKAALGPETPGVPAGPFHRAGQPCLVCHSAYGGAHEFTVAGTVFADTTSYLPAADVEVVLTDAIGTTMTAVSNCIGNFYIPAASWNAQFPLAAEIHYPVYNKDGSIQMQDKKQVYKVKAMGSWISRNGSCAFCHTLRGREPTLDASSDIVDYNSSGWLYCNAPASSTSPADTNFFPKLDSSCVGKEPKGPVPKELSAAVISDDDAESTASAGGGT